MIGFSKNLDAAMDDEFEAMMQSVMDTLPEQMTGDDIAHLCSAIVHSYLETPLAAMQCAGAMMDYLAARYDDEPEAKETMQ